MLGKREPEHYGRQTLGDIIEELENLADDYEVRLYNFQSNAEHEIVERIQAALNEIDFIIINPAAFTHTSVAIRDALATVKIPFIEVHLSNIHKREAFRTHSYFSDLAEGVIAGLGPIGYQLALAAAVEKLK
jgi:3-dehydroquinate dehydratase-2